MATKENIANIKKGSKIKHLKFGLGEVLEVNNKGVANIMFERGETRIILKFAKLEIIE